jgi:serine/threonine protein kinase
MARVSILKPDIPGYRILRRLGNGGMSEIWLAEQVALARPVAIKIVSLGAEAEARIARFRQEAALIARFDHPNVVGIIEFGETADGRLFFSMPYVPNGTLAEAGLHGDGPRMREVLAQILDALAYVHEHGVVHRDVKPENVLFDSVGRARLADFGVSRSIESVSRHTREGETFGSSHYMSPEQARGEVPDGRSDLYSVGAMAYEILTGAPPFHGPDHLSVVVGHLQSPIPRLPEHLRHWQGWIDSALAKKPEHRPANAVAMRNALTRLPEQPWAGWPGQAKTLARHWSLPVLIVLAIAVALWRFSVADRTHRAAMPTTVEPGDETRMPSAVSTSASPLAEAANSATLPSNDERATSSPPEIDGQATRTVQPDVSAPGPVESESSMSGDAAQSGPAGSVPSSASAESATQPASSRRGTPVRPSPAAVSTANEPISEVPPPPAFAATFESVPKIPLFLLAGSRDEQVRRIDEYLDNGRRAIESDRVNVENQRRNSDDREQRRQMRDAFDQRKANYETWRRQLLDLREKARGLK